MVFIQTIQSIKVTFHQIHQKALSNVTILTNRTGLSQSENSYLTLRKLTVQVKGVKSCGHGGIFQKLWTSVRYPRREKEPLATTGIQLSGGQLSELLQDVSYSAVAIGTLCNKRSRVAQWLTRTSISFSCSQPCSLTGVALPWAGVARAWLSPVGWVLVCSIHQFILELAANRTLFFTG